MFSQYFTAFLKSTSNPSKIRKDSQLMSFRNYRLPNTCFCKCIKGHVPVHPRTVNMLMGPKHCCNLHDNSFFQLCSSLSEIFTRKKSFLVISKVLRKFVNTLTSNEKYFLYNRDNLPKQIQMQLPKKLKVFLPFCTGFLKPKFNYKDFEKKDESESLCLSELIDSEVPPYVND